MKYKSFSEIKIELLAGRKFRVAGDVDKYIQIDRYQTCKFGLVRNHYDVVFYIEDVEQYRRPLYWFEDTYQDGVTKWGEYQSN